MANVVYLHGAPRPIAQFLRVGSSGHRQLELLLASGKLPNKQFIIEAGSFTAQKDLIAALKQSGRELALDTNVAELSSIGRYQGTSQGAPWADHDGVLTAQHFQAGANDFDVVGRIARFVVDQGIGRVHAPTHLLQSGVKDGWFRVDRHSCEMLRRLLDVNGGKQIPIDYPLLISNAVLNDAAERKALVASLKSLPIGSIWFRVSGFGADATAAGVRKYISALQDFHELNLPIVADGVGGFAALAILSFGSACGLAHGVAEKERFEAAGWNKPPKSGWGGGGYNVLLPGIDRLLKKSEAEALIAFPGARRLLSCNDRNCCPHGFEDTIKNPKAHYLRQRTIQCEEISSISEPRRPQHFLDTTMANADRTARLAAKLKVTDESIAEMLVKNSGRLDRMRSVLDDLNKTSKAPEGLPGLPPVKAEEEIHTGRR